MVIKPAGDRRQGTGDIAIDMRVLLQPTSDIPNPEPTL